MSIEQVTSNNTENSREFRSAKSLMRFGISRKNICAMNDAIFMRIPSAFRNISCHFIADAECSTSSSQQITSKYFNFVLCKPLARFWFNATRMSFALAPRCVGPRYTIECIYNLQFVNAVETCTLLTTHRCQKPETGIVFDGKNKRIRKMNINQYVKAHGMFGQSSIAIPYSSLCLFGYCSVRGTVRGSLQIVDSNVGC